MSGLRPVVNVVQFVAAAATLAFVVLLFVNEPDDTGGGGGGGGQAADDGGGDGGGGDGGGDAGGGGGGVDGAAVFAGNCAGCHGGDGGGGTGPQLSDGQVLASFPNVEDQITLVTGGRGNMPAFGDQLSEDEIRAVVEYTRTL